VAEVATTLSTLICFFLSAFFKADLVATSLKIPTP